MFSIVMGLGRWVFRRIVLLLLILVALWAGWLVQSQLKDLADLEGNLQYLKSGEAKLRGDLKDLERQTEQSVLKLKAAAVEQLDQRIAELSKQIESNNTKILELDTILNKLNPAKHLDIARLKIEIEFSSQELEHLRYLKELSSQSSKVGRLTEYCEKIRLQHVAEWNAYQAVNVSLDRHNATASLHSQWNPLSAEYSLRTDLEKVRDGHAKNTQHRKTQYEQCLSNQAAAQRVLSGLEQVKAFVLKNQKVQMALGELQSHIQSIQGTVDKHWFKPILFDPLKQIFPIALGILATAIVVPLAIKLCLYFVLAPLSAKSPPICLLPESGARNNLPSIERDSAVSLALEIHPDSELVVLPLYFHSAPERCKTSSKFVLNASHTMTCLAAGMYNLTSIQSEVPFVATVSSGQESLAELLSFQLLEGEVLCLRPINLVGVIQNCNTPVRVTSHWRLGSLQAWLTLQLRYLVFYGPATFIVKGCRGVRVVPVSDGKSVEQGSTVGFSANLNYSTTRTETLMAYLTGKKGLLRDRFYGQKGIFIYEEMPDPSKRAGITGRGFEGVSDAILKLFGI